MPDRRPWDTGPHGPVQHALQAGLVVGVLSLQAGSWMLHILAELRDIGTAVAELGLTIRRRRRG